MRLTFILLIFFLIENFFPIGFFGARIEFFLLVTFYFALHNGAISGFLCGLGLGILKELFSSGAFGSILLPFVLIAVLAGLFKERLYFESLIPSLSFVFAATLLGYFVQFLISGDFSLGIVLSAFLSALVSPIVFSIINVIARERSDRSNLIV